MTPIRLVLVVDDLDVGGVPRVVLHLARGLDPGRFSVTILCLSDQLTGLSVDPLPEAVRLEVLPISFPQGHSAWDYVSDGFLPWRTRSRSKPVLESLRRLRPEILHFHTRPRRLAIGAVAARKGAMELVFTDHVVRLRPGEYPLPQQLLVAMALRRLYRPFHIVSVGEAVESMVRGLALPSAGRRHVLLRNQVDLSTFRPPAPGQPRGDPVDIVYVARLHRVKGHATLLRAFAALETKLPVRLTLVGPDHSDGALQRLVAEIGREDRPVRFLGARRDVPELLRAADIGVFPSLREGRPLAALEMMATGLPIVVSDIPELQAIVTDEVDGLVVPRDDVSALAQALQRLVEDPGLRRRLGGQAAATVRAQAGADPVQTMARFYQEVAGRG